VTEIRIREAARAVVLDGDERVLLTRFEFPDRPRVWTTVGGGLEPGETYEDAVRRELAEEAGLQVTELGPCIWTRDHLIAHPVDFDVQRERFFLVRTPAFEPAPHHTWAQLKAEGMTEIRWWTIAGILGATGVRFGPRRLGPLLEDLLRDGPPAEPIDVGI
jgi:8-oxo-dGTP pyrophosphatase MutT (NUDIX family)